MNKRAPGLLTPKRPAHSSVLALFALLNILAVFLLILSMQTYAQISQMQFDDNTQRSQLSFITQITKSIDETNCLSTRKGPEGTILVLSEREGSNTYETRIYLYKGNLVERYVSSDEPVNPSKAIKIVATEIFTFTFDNGLITITTESGQTQIALRSTQEVVL